MVTNITNNVLLENFNPRGIARLIFQLNGVCFKHTQLTYEQIPNFFYSRTRHIWIVKNQ